MGIAVPFSTHAPFGKHLVESFRSAFSRHILSLSCRHLFARAGKLLQLHLQCRGRCFPIYYSGIQTSFGVPRCHEKCKAQSWKLHAIPRLSWPFKLTCVGQDLLLPGTFLRPHSFMSESTELGRLSNLTQAPQFFFLLAS